MKEHSVVRKIIVFAVFFVALGIIAPTIILYSLGYRFDKNNEVFVHSGSVVLKTTPFAIQLFIEGKEIPQKSIDFINRSFNINGLAPKDYEVKIDANGFYPWRKKVEVHSGIATEFWNVVLVPDQVEKNTIMEDNLLEYAFSPDKKKIACFVNKNDHISLLVREQDQDLFVYEEPVNQRFAPSPGELKWSPDGQWLLFSLRKNNQETIFLTYAGDGYSEIIPAGEAWRDNLPVAPGVQQGNKSKKTKQKLTEEKPIAYFWDNQGSIYFVIDGVVYNQSAASMLDWWRNSALNHVVRDSAKESKNLSFGEDYSPFKVRENSNGFAFCGNYLCSINTPERKLEVFDQRGELKKSVSFPDNYQMTGKYQIYAYSDEQVAIADEQENLFLWDEIQNKKEGREGMKFIFPGVREVYFSNDGKKLLFATKNEAYVYFVKEWEVQPKHTAGDLEVVFRDSNELKEVQWYIDYQNIFVAGSEGIKMIELDGRGGRNSADFLKASNISNLSYDTVEKKFWFIEEGEGGINKLQEIPFPTNTGMLSGIMNNTNSQ